MTAPEIPETEIGYEQVPPGSLLDKVLRGLDVNFALSALRNSPVVGDRQRRVIELRYGLIDGQTRKQKEVAEQIGRAAATIAREETEAMITLKNLRDSISPEKVFPRPEIFLIDNYHLAKPSRMKKNARFFPPVKPKYEYPEIE